VPIGLIAHFAAITRWGASGASWVTTILSILAASASVAAVYAAWKILPSRITLIRSGLISVSAYVAAVAWPAAGPMLVTKLAVIGGLILAAFFGSGEFARDEISLLYSLMRPEPQESDFSG
jgi:hypothetical protein